MTEQRQVQRDIQAELKGLRLNGMAAAWGDLVEQGGSAELGSSCWLVEHLLQAEEVNRHMRSIAHQTKAARFPVHRDLAGFNFEVSQVDKALVHKLADLQLVSSVRRQYIRKVGQLRRVVLLINLPNLLFNTLQFRIRGRASHSRVAVGWSMHVAVRWASSVSVARRRVRHVHVAMRRVSMNIV